MSNGRETRRLDDDVPDYLPDRYAKVGTVIDGKYEILGCIGEGGFGAVYVARNQNIPDQQVAVKFWTSDQVSLEIFAREPNILAKLDHPNICPIINYLESERAVITKYIAGKGGAAAANLGEIAASAPDTTASTGRSKRVAKLPEKMLRRVALAVGRALQHAHEKRIAHRDLKPSNIMIDGNDHVYLIDFGIAKRVDLLSQDRGSEATIRAWTPGYVAPERKIPGSKPDPFLSDIYEFGVTIYRLATGILPYADTSDDSVEDRDWDNPPKGKISRDFARVLRKATQRNPSSRYASMADLMVDLEAITDFYPPGRKRARRIVLSLGLVAVVVGAAYVGWRAYDGGYRPFEVEAQDTVAVMPPVDEEETDQGVVPDTGQAPVPPDSTAPEPPSPMPARLAIAVEPVYDVHLEIDGVKRNPDQLYRLAVGTHHVRVTHPDYPILDTTFQIGKGETMRKKLDLAEVFASSGTIEFRVVVNPRESVHELNWTLNGRTRRIRSFPKKESILKGKWDQTAEILSLSGAGANRYVVDSCVTDPWNLDPDVPRIRLQNDSIVDFGSLDWLNVDRAQIVVYWHSPS